MSFLDWPLEQDREPQRKDARRRRVAEATIELFSKAFVQINYQLVWSSRIINAQAWRLGEAQNVYLYGGLVRHRKIALAGLALTLAHETGHHLGGQPRDPVMTWMTWQGQADYWAANVGMPTVFGSDARDLTLRGARQISALQKEVVAQDEHQVELSPRVRCAIYRAGLRHDGLPRCALVEFERQATALMH
jgi:hypothetical protein